MTFVVVALHGDETMVASSHVGKACSDEIWFGIVIGVAKDVTNRDRVSGHEPATADEAAVNKCVPVGAGPARDEVVVLHVVHFL